MMIFVSSNAWDYTRTRTNSSTDSKLHKKATIHLVTTMLATSKNVLFPGHNHQLTTGTDDSSF